MTDPRRIATEAVYNAILDARRVAGDGVVIDALDQVGASASQYRYAAAALRGLPPGRPAIDDAWALRHILKFPPDQRRDAVGIVAKRAAGAGASSKKIKSTARRLHRKLENQTDEIVLSLALTP